METPSPAQMVPSTEDHVQTNKILREYIAIKDNGRPTRFVQDLDYLHERLYRTVSGVMVSDDPFRTRLDSVQLMLLPLRPSDFPRELRDPFAKIVDVSPSCEESTAERLLRSLVELYLDISERVMNYATLLGRDEEAAWCVMQAQEGRAEPLRAMMRNLRKWKQVLPVPLVTFRSHKAKGLIKGRRGPTSLHPARVIAIARMVRDRMKFHQLENASASLNVAAQHVGDWIGKGLGTPKANYRLVYQPNLSDAH
ncbi:MAG: hypothetical protein ABIU05_19750 [Nitrospirales bacterium]